MVIYLFVRVGMFNMLHWMFECYICVRAIIHKMNIEHDDSDCVAGCIPDCIPFLSIPLDPKVCTRTHISLIIWIFNDHQNVSYIIEFTRPPLSSGHVCGLWRMLTYFKRWLFRSWDAIVEWGLGYFRLPFRLGGPILQHSSHTIESWCMIIKQIPNYLQEMLLFSG